MNNNPRMSPISGNNSLGFALNGTRRISGIVGQTNLQQNRNIKMSCCTNDSNVIKPSVKNTKGMLSVKYCKMNYDTICNVVQPTETISQTQYIKEKYIGCSDQNIQQINAQCHNSCKNKFKGSYTKSPIGAISHSEYIKGRVLKKKAFLPSPCMPSFPHRINNNGCNIYYN